MDSIQHNKNPVFSEYPRVLIIHMACIYKTDQHGLLLRNIFAEWPREHLAQIYSGADELGEPFCEQTFKLGPSERRLGNLFFHIKDSALGESIKPIILEKSHNQSSLHKVKRTTILKSKISSFLLSTGIWEVIFSPRLSNRLVKWVEEFSPQIIYCSGYSLSFCWLPMLLNARFKTPLVFHASDDWPNYLYRRSPVHSLVLRTSKKLVQSSSVRIAFSTRMAEGYCHQFGSPFDDIVMLSDNLERFTTAKPQRVTDDNVISIVYTGGLALGRWQSLLDLCDAADVLRAEGTKIEIAVFVSVLPVEATTKLRNRSGLNILPPLAHQEVPGYLKGADILFLPETFDPKIATAIRYSISTKAHLYMMSKQPILVYGSPTTGVVDYAKREGWGYVVDEPKFELLVHAIRQLSSNNELRSHLAEAAIQIFLRYHDQKTVSQHFHDIIQNAIIN